MLVVWLTHESLEGHPSTLMSTCLLYMGRFPIWILLSKMRSVVAQYATQEKTILLSETPKEILQNIVVHFIHQVLTFFTFNPKVQTTRRWSLIWSYYSNPPSPPFSLCHFLIVDAIAFFSLCRCSMLSMRSLLCMVSLLGHPPC